MHIHQVNKRFKQTLTLLCLPYMWIMLFLCPTILRSTLRDRFEMVDNGEAHYILGMMITRDKRNKVLTVQCSQHTHGAWSFLLRGIHRLIDIYQQVIGCLTYASTSTRVVYVHFGSFKHLSHQITVSLNFGWWSKPKF